MPAHTPLFRTPPDKASARLGLLAYMLASFAVLLISATAPAQAARPQPAGTQPHLCHAVTETEPVQTPMAAQSYRCTGDPSGYQDRWLWLKHDFSPTEQSAGATSLLIRQTRFAQMIVAFSYADGATHSDRLRSGAFGDRWTVGGHLAFTPPTRSVPVTTVTIGFERLAAHDLLRIHLMETEKQARANAVTAAVVGGALSLLAASFVYNLFLFSGQRQRFIFWHVAWVACMLSWGILWSQLALLLAPRLAGIWSVRLCAVLASGAIASATMFFVSSLEAGKLPAWMRRSLAGLAAAVVLLAIPAVFEPVGYASLLAMLLNSLVLLLVAVMIASVTLAWRRGSRAARSFAQAWTIPALAVTLSTLADIGLRTPNAAAELFVLGGSALQTVWLSVTITIGLSALRTERDHARAQQAELQALAETDPLTGLYNRRGFVARAQLAIGWSREQGGHIGLLLLDVDHFKSINDGYGHDVGDLVLQRVAGTLSLASEDATVGRLGGEEFGILVTGLGREALLAFADHVRRTLAGADLSDLFGELRQVTASFGVVDARAAPDADFERLYRVTDRALYRAKALGRNRVIEADARDVDKADSLALAS